MLASTPLQQTNSYKPLRILLVEDEDIIAMLTEDMLNDLGHIVGYCAANLDDGLKAAAEGQFDFAVLDVNLRGATSYPIANILRERGIPFLFASGYSGEGIANCYEGIRTLQKPFSADMLSDAIGCAVESQP